jgi:Rps23 Pro-64 3,4-dihydroxylase Tpa1-like proline 4-hydroxylase
MKVVDNFLPKEDFLKIQSLLSSWDFPWYYQSKINLSHTEDDLDCYFTHMIFEKQKGYSNFYPSLLPLLNKINFKALIRVKCNIYSKTDKVEIHKPHIDYDFKHKGAIFYINTNDGGTILENGKKIDSVENRILFFDSYKKHSSTSTSNAKSRINININYF